MNWQSSAASIGEQGANHDSTSNTRNFMFSMLCDFRLMGASEASSLVSNSDNTASLLEAMNGRKFHEIAVIVGLILGRWIMPRGGKTKLKTFTSSVKNVGWKRIFGFLLKLFKVLCFILKFLADDLNFNQLEIRPTIFRPTFFYPWYTIYLNVVTILTACAGKLVSGS